MQFINLQFSGGRDEVLAAISNNEYVNRNVRFEEQDVKPLMKLKEKNGRVRVTCEMLGKPTKDNGFLVGTYFSGKLVEKNGATRLKGIITTAPIYHLAMLVLVCVFIYQCISLKGFSVVPILLVGLSLFMFKDEFKKQGYIKRYLSRAERRFNSDKSSTR